MDFKSISGCFTTQTFEYNFAKNFTGIANLANALPQMWRLMCHASFPLLGAIMSPTQNAFQTDLEGTRVIGFLLESLTSPRRFRSSLESVGNGTMDLDFTKVRYRLLKTLCLLFCARTQCSTFLGFQLSFLIQTGKTNVDAWNMAGSPFPATPFVPFGIE